MIILISLNEVNLKISPYYYQNEMKSGFIDFLIKYLFDKERYIFLWGFTDIYNSVSVREYGNSINFKKIMKENIFGVDVP